MVTSGKIYKPRHKPYNHQKEAARRLKGQTAFALLMAMRTGKTKVILDDFGMLELNNVLDDILIIAPAGVYNIWLTEIKEHLSADLLQRLDVHLWDAGAVSKLAQKRELSFMNKLNVPRALIVDVEALSTVDRLRQLCIQFLSQRRAETVIDESTTIKDPDSARASFVLDKLRPLSKYRRIMTGLPTPNSPFDLFGQFFFLDPDILGHSYVNYKKYYAEIDEVCMVPNEVLYGKLERRLGRRFNLPGVGMVEPRDLSRKHVLQIFEEKKIWVPKIPIIKRYRNEEELHQTIAPHSYRVLLKDCYDMPEKIYMKREVKLTPEQKRIYNELKLTSQAQLASKDFVTPNMVITRLLRMHQVLCGHVVDEEGKFHGDIPENRTKELMAILREYDGKAIIWCSYDPNIRKISEALVKEYGQEAVARFWGGNRKTREQEEEEFKKNPRCRFNVATPQAGGRGRRWSMANLMVYYSNTNNLEHRSQSEERGEEVGKLEPMACIDLVVPGTVDEKIIQALRKKINMATTITGDDYQEWLV